MRSNLFPLCFLAAAHRSLLAVGSARDNACHAWVRQGELEGGGLDINVEAIADRFDLIDRRLCETSTFLMSFLCVCPEPVLANRRVS